MVGRKKPRRSGQARQAPDPERLRYYEEVHARRKLGIFCPDCGQPFDHEEPRPIRYKGYLNLPKPNTRIPCRQCGRYLRTIPIAKSQPDNIGLMLYFCDLCHWSGYVYDIFPEA